MLTVMIKWNKSCHKLKIILSLFIAFSLICSVGAACLRPQVVYAGVAGTIAGYILTLFASFNTAITNPEVVTAINNTFGQMAMAEADAAMIDQGIASIAASTGFDMASIFASTAEEAAQVIASAPAGSVLEGAEAIAATAGENIAAGGIACAVTGSVLPAIGGLVIPAVAAVALGVAGGFLINHIRERIMGNVKNGFPLNTSQSIINSFPPNASSVLNLWVNSGSNYNYYTYDPVLFAACSYGSYYEIYCLNLSSSRIKLYDGYDSVYYYVNESSMKRFISPNSFIASPDIPIFNSYGDMSDYFNNLKNGTLPVPETVSPDIIGDIGNQKAENDNGNYTLPNIYPVYNYGDTIINYINPTDYNTFIQNANQNTDDGLTGEDTQGDYFDNFVTPYIQPVEDIPENPNPDVPNPEQKPTVPYPDPEEYPDAIPEVNPVPDTDIAPTAIPYPELPEPTDTEITETNDKITPFNLKNKFPFCLPFDIHKALSKLKGAREAPYFVWNIPFGDAGEQTVTVDLRAWDEVASILRLLELLLFIVGLAVATRNLIGGT